MCYLDDLVVTNRLKTHFESSESPWQIGESWVSPQNKQVIVYFQPKVQYLWQRWNSTPCSQRNLMEMPNPNNQKELNLFLGMVNYYYRFTPGLASKCANLNELLHKESVWQWCKHLAASVHKIKTALISTEALAYYDPSLPLNLSCDSVGIESVIFTPSLTIQNRW